MKVRKLRFGNLFFIIFISYIVVLAIPIIMTGAIHFQSENIVEKQIKESNEAVLKQMKLTIDQRLNEIDMLESQILTNQAVSKIMFTDNLSTGNKMMSIVEMIDDFSSYKNIMPFVSDFFIYFYNIDYIVSANSSSQPEFYFNNFIMEDMSYEDWKENYLLVSHGSENRYAIINSNLLASGKGLCFFKSLPYTADQIPIGNICVLIDAGKFTELLSNIEEIQGGMAYIVDGQQIIASSPSAEILELSQPLSGESGVLSRDINGVDYILSYTSAGELGWKYVTVVPEDVLQEQISSMRQFTVMAVYICVAVALIIILYLTYRNYKPILNIARQFDEDAEASEKIDAFEYIEDSIRNITNKNKEFYQTIESYQPLFLEGLLRRLLYEDPEASDEEIKTDLTSYGVEFPEPCFLDILLCVEDSSRFRHGNSEQERNYVRLILSNISEEVAGEIGCAKMVEVGKDMMCLILNLPEMSAGECRQRVSAVCEKIKGEIERYFKIVLTISVGALGKGCGAIHTSYQQAARAMDYRLIRGISSILYAEDIVQNTSTPSYPAETENALLNCVRTGNYPKAEEILDGLFAENFERRSLSASLGKCLFFDIVSTAVKLMDSMNIDYNSVFGSDFNPVESLLSCETIPQAKERMLFIYRKICDSVNSNKRSHNDELKENLLTYIEENYADEALSQTMIAEHFGISPNYLSNFFREQTGERMSAYISRIRIKKAKELLENTDWNISRIAASVGFGSDLSLIRVFKKLENLTPGQYRSLKKK